tara:strand:- start:2159 stop:3925 length:1767 start_codon:yes stop_codon:yes gene_type:complete
VTGKDDKLGAVTKTLEEIRSEACNIILVTFTVLAIPAVMTSLLRGLEQGWKPVMGAHIVLFLALVFLTTFRRHLSLSLRAAAITAIPFIIAVGGLLTYGRGNGVVVFFVSSCVLAGCFFGRRTALGVVGLCVVALAALYGAFYIEIISLPLNPATFNMTPLSWLTYGAGFIAAVATPIIGISALIQSLDAERHRADEAVKVRSRFLANISHELRTPMAGVIGMTEVLHNTQLDQRQRTMVTSLMQAGHSLLVILNDLLDFSKFETGRVPIEPLPFSLTDMIQTVCAGYMDSAAQKGIELKVQFSPEIRDAVIGDSMRISQVLSNLISNALKFTERGSVTVSIEQTLTEDGIAIVTFSVTDTGIGIPDEQVSRIFDPFIQADMSISRTHGGSGLGLSICRTLVNAMDGDILVSSRPNEGSTFTVRIPLALQTVSLQGNTKAIQTAEATLPVAGKQTRKPLCVLIADDDANMRTLAEIMLSNRGHKLTIVNDGGAALAAARTNTYDCILMDMHMPVLDGPEVIRALREDETSTKHRTPIIALTADVVTQHVRAFMESGADAVIAKPVVWDLLEDKMQKLTNARVVNAEPS